MGPVKAIRAVTGMTQHELASVAATSQPAVAAYESGSKSPTWRTVERIARSVGLACYPVVCAALTRDQQRSLLLHAVVAKELRDRGPEVLKIAQRNIDRMRSVNPHAARLLDEWELILQAPIDRIVSRMLDPSDHGRDLRQVSPFGGVLTPAQRTAFYRSYEGSV